MEDGSEPRVKRQKRERPGKRAAFDKLKELKGSKNKYEISEVNDVYDVVDEKEYTKRVIGRQIEDWIVDDDGAGYVEDGREIFDDDLDADSIAAASSSKDKKKKKRKAVSEQAGKGNLQFLISNMPSKKKEQVKLDDDDVLSELISELDDATPSNCSTPQRSSIIKPKPMSNFTFSSEKKEANDYVKSFTAKKLKSTPLKPIRLIVNETEEPVQHVAEKPSEKILREIEMNCRKPEIIEPNKDVALINEKIEKTKCGSSEVIEEFKSQDMFDDGFDLGQIEDVPTQDEIVVKANDDIPNDFLGSWDTMQGDTNTTKCEINVNKSQIPMVTNEEGKKVFRFYWWDAYENAAKRPGEVLLFGKTYIESAKSYVSCCVVVRNIERKVYLLPRPTHLDNNHEPSDQPVSLHDVYKEFNTSFAPLLTLRGFKSRPSTKNYCFDPQIPTESEYLEVRYDAKSPRMDSEMCNNGGKTFSRVFGSRSSFLELLLLERKIKGPCWLEIENPEPDMNPLSYCKFEVKCSEPKNLHIAQNKNVSPPPLVLATLNMRTLVNSKNMSNEIVMISVLVHHKYAVDKKRPNPFFEEHFCVFTKLSEQILPLDIHEALTKYKGTRVQKMDSERALLNYFIIQLSKIDPDLVVGHDLQDYQIGLLCERLLQHKTNAFSKLGRVKRSDLPTKRILERELFLGRLVCDIKVSARELIKSRSYNLETLCQTVLKLPENQRLEIDSEEVPKFYQTSADLLKLITLTMEDSAYILKMMYELNAIPLALQITNIAGNVMSRTLLGGRSERNEFLLLHAFYEKNYIVPDKEYNKDGNSAETQQRSTASRKKPTYSGGLVLDPKIGFYDKLILLMDFNSLYPSIIQEYNICFTTVPATNEEQVVLPDSSLPLGILPVEIRKLVESRREVKKLMNNSDISADLRMQYNIRQMALKLTANSMYGCLGFSNSRFYAKNLAALVTHKGREILTNTKDLVSKLNYDVIYGDTDSIMINTNNLDYDEVMKVGIKIKQEVNRLYRQVELDIDGVFKYLLLLKKKKYAAVVLFKNKNGELETQKEHKGLDIVRRDWSKLAAHAGEFILEQILSDQSFEDRIENINSHLVKLKEDLHQKTVPLSLLLITKQLTKDPRLYADKNQLPHVQVALRYNKKGGRVLRAGDTVPYIICEDGTTNGATQRAYHVEELKNSDTLKIDIKYYLAQQIHPVISRLCEPLPGIDSYEIASRLGLDMASFKKPINKSDQDMGENLKKRENRFCNVSPFIFKCDTCKMENKITGILNNGVPFLSICANPECSRRPVDYLPHIQNQLTIRIREFIKKYYRNELTCEDPACINDTIRLPSKFAGKYPICTFCKKGVMYKKYTENDLYNQLSYFEHIFDLSKMETTVIMESKIEAGYHILKEAAEKILKHSGYAMINLTQLYSAFLIHDKGSLNQITADSNDLIYYDENDGEDDF